MSYYPIAPLNTWDLICLSIKYYAKTFKLVLPLVLLSVIVKDVYLYFGLIPQQRLLFAFIDIVIVVIQVYIWSVAFYATHGHLQGKPEGLQRSCRFVLSKASNIYMGVFGYILLFCAVFFVGFGVYKFVIWVTHENSIIGVFAMLLAIGIPVNLCLLLFLLALPMLAIDPILPTLALRLSIQLVWWRNILKVLLLYIAVMFVLMLISVHTAHGRWLYQHHVNILFNFVILMIFAPLLVNYTLLLLNDLRLRAK